jgi:ribosome-associated heat shock protein Hsp15
LKSESTRLWAARFFKTRSLAAEAVAGGKVALNGARPKPSRTIRPCDHLNIRRGVYEWIIIVKETSTYRGRASDAQRLYDETEESRSTRQAVWLSLNSNGQPIFIAQDGLPKRIGAQYRNSPIADGDLR